MDENWNNWTWQLQHRIDSLEKLEEQVTLTDAERAGCVFAKKSTSLGHHSIFHDVNRQAGQ